MWPGSSGFHIVPTLVAIRCKLKTGHPFRCPTHYITDFINRHIHRSLDYDLIMHMSYDPKAAEAFHGVCKYVTADGLNTILYDSGVICLDPAPVPAAVNAVIRN